jgi:hypothetical protein
MHTELRKVGPPEKPQGIEICETLPRSVVLKVLPPANNGGLRIESYKIEYDGNTIYCHNDEKVRVNNLQPGTTYILQIRAVNNHSIGASADFVVETNFLREPDPPIITSPAISNHTTEYVVSWVEKNDGGLPIEEYRLSYRTVVKESNWTHQYILPEDFSPNLKSGYTATHTLTDLRPNMRYQLEILARNKFGWSNSSETSFEFTTAKEYEPKLGHFTNQSNVVKLGQLHTCLLLIIQSTICICLF